MEWPVQRRGGMSRCALLALALAACSPADADDQPPLERPDVVRETMRTQFKDLRDIQDMLLAGKLEDAKARAFMLTKPATDPGLAPLAAQTQAVVDAATELVDARTIPEACRKVARVAGACASCHVHMPRPLRAPPETEPPTAQPTLSERMQRHAWATDRLWEGAVLGDIRRWREGVETLAMAPVPIAGREALANRLQLQAQSALRDLDAGAGTVHTRATAYGEMLVTCAECHAQQVVSSR